MENTSYLTMLFGKLSNDPHRLVRFVKFSRMDQIMSIKFSYSVKGPFEQRPTVSSLEESVM